MTLYVVALDNEQFRSRFYAVPNSFSNAPIEQQIEAADHLLQCCIEDCQITKFSGNLSIPDKPIFDGWAEALPDLRLLRTCLQFLRGLESIDEQDEVQPWWITYATLHMVLVEPEKLEKFSNDVHESKFFEVLLANMVTGKAAYEFIELGQFLELSGVNKCSLLVWQE